MNWRKFLPLKSEPKQKPKSKRIKIPVKAGNLATQMNMAVHIAVRKGKKNDRRKTR